ncbi:hypothetical protein ABIB40_002998 [Pedobacter sp. UYP30]|uniref:type II toxin-antitoxin system HicA family toxin n=1 Tax=Pedobacter sp. UYP30 TaxID=1756400 RepID=UPI0033907EBE
MAGAHLRNIPLKLYRDFLTDKGCVCTRTCGGHEHWTRNDLLRPITIQNHIDPVPEFIIKNGLRTLGLSKKDFLDWI